LSEFKTCQYCFGSVCKKLKKKVKNKKYQFTKGLYEKLLNWKETDPKQYWQVLN
jgi:hypothetical protein